MNNLILTVFNRSVISFIKELEQEGIDYRFLIQKSAEPQNSGKILEIINAASEAMPWNALAKVIIKWLESRASREVIITSKNNEIFHAKGHSATDVQKMLLISKSVVIIDTESDNER